MSSFVSRERSLGGVDAVSIDEIMAGVGLTRGGFYSYFASKGELYSLAVGSGLADGTTTTVTFKVVDLAQRVISAYLSEERSRTGAVCWPLLSLPSPVTRHDDPVKCVFERVFAGMVEMFEQTLEHAQRADRDRALVISSVCVGALALARALDGSRLASEVRKTALRQALELGGWTSDRRHSMRSQHRGQSTKRQHQPVTPSLQDGAMASRKRRHGMTVKTHSNVVPRTAANELLLPGTVTEKSPR
jgi:TetR/AcrR family transcriptional regulator, transcriptional repressor for nem operon